MSHQCILSLFLFVLIPFQALSFNHSIGPLAHCGVESIDSRQYVEGCFQRCNKPSAPSRHGTISIYSELPENKGPVVVHCQKVKLTQTFTETWTLSQVKSSPIIEYTPVPRAECEAKIKQSCPTYECNVKAPSEIDPEYHFASDTKLEKTFISLLSMPSSIDFLDDEMRVTPMTSLTRFKYSQGFGEDTFSTYIWNPQDVGKCPFSSVGVVGCDYYDPPKDTLECRGSRIVIEEFSKSTPLSGLCVGLNRSVGGLLYQWEPRDLDRNSLNGKSFISPQIGESNELASVRAQVSSALAVIDEDLCQIQCEIMEIISRVNLGKESLLRLGNRYVAFSKTGFARDCNPITTCKLIMPHSFCGNPVRLGVSCDGKQYMWNPLKSFVEPLQHCHAIRGDENLRISLGNHIYDIDQSLTVNASESDLIGLSHDYLTVSHSSLKAGTVDISELRSAWASFKNKDTSMNASHESVRHQMDHWDMPAMSLDFLGSVPRVIGEFFKKVYAWTIFGCTLVAILWGYSWYKRTFDTGRGNLRDNNRFQLIERGRNQPQWI